MTRTQASLFDDALPDPAPELVALARRIPPGLHYGTSTWTYEGWAGDVYHRRYKGADPARRLEEYVRYPLFGTVGIDSAFYEPPGEHVLTAYAKALPPGFRCVSKVWDRITAKRFSRDKRWGDLAGQPNPDFLNAQVFHDAVLTPYARAFREHSGPFVFEFQAMRGKDRPDPVQWADELDAFLTALPAEFQYAVELRTPQLLTEFHGDVLRRHGVAHVFNSWTEMPSVGDQLALGWTMPAPFVVVRALMRPGLTYQDSIQRFEPYDRIREPSTEIRDQLAALTIAALKERHETYVVVNNRLEGNAPGTIRALVERWGGA
jgi:uncharacterized protein YecE (DUF72 family)